MTAEPAAVLEALDRRELEERQAAVRRQAPLRSAISRERRGLTQRLLSKIA
jgi:hypothetical protein